MLEHVHEQHWVYQSGLGWWDLRTFYVLTILALLDVLGEAVPDLVRHHVVKEAEVCALLLTQIGFDQIQQFRDSLGSSLFIKLHLLLLRGRDRLLLDFLFFLALFLTFLLHLTLRVVVTFLIGIDLFFRLVIFFRLLDNWIKSEHTLSQLDLFGFFFRHLKTSTTIIIIAGIV